MIFLFYASVIIFYSTCFTTNGYAFYFCIATGSFFQHALHSIMHHIKNAVGNINWVVVFSILFKYCIFISALNRIDYMRGYVPTFVGYVSHFVCNLKRRNIYFALTNTNRSKTAVIPMPFTKYFIIILRSWNVTFFF